MITAWHLHAGKSIAHPLPSIEILYECFDVEREHMLLVVDNDLQEIADCTLINISLASEFNPRPFISIAEADNEAERRSYLLKAQSDPNAIFNNMVRVTDQIKHTRYP